MPDAVILDPSVFAAEFWAPPGTLPRDLYLPASFVEIVQAKDEAKRVRLENFYRDEIDNPYLDLDAIAGLIEQHGIRSYSLPAESGPFVEFQALLNAEVESPVSDIVFEEWVFLMSNSQAWSKVRRVYDAMINAGAAAIEVSKETAEKLNRRLLKKSGDAPLTRTDILRVTAKWVAVAGPPLVTLLTVPPALGVASAMVPGIFMMYDP